MQTIGTGDKGILKPTFYRKVQTLTNAKRSRTRVKGVSTYVFEGITLRRLLRDAGQASFDDKPEDKTEEKPERKFESDDD